MPSASARQAREAEAAPAVIDELPAAVARTPAVPDSTSTVLSGVAVRADAADYETPRSGCRGHRRYTRSRPRRSATLARPPSSRRCRPGRTWATPARASASASSTPASTTPTPTSAARARVDGVQRRRRPRPPAFTPDAPRWSAATTSPATPTTPTRPRPGYDPVPQPDANPLDCNGHGTHVAGTAAGYGVDGRRHAPTPAATRTGWTRQEPRRSGPAWRPRPSLYALKVFGCEGSTDVTRPGARVGRWTPNGDGDVSDHLDVVNLSLGSDYGLADDADAMAIDRAVAAGRARRRRRRQRR